MIQLLFATQNQHKVAEIQAAVGTKIKVISLLEAGIDQDIPEPHETLEANASEKSQVIFAMCQIPCFSEDTGLEVGALEGRPGVKSARYAGDERSFEKNTQKVLAELLGIETRMAQFRTVISLIWGGKEYQFEGICEGEITLSPTGEKGFGYDPIFKPTGSDKTFAEMNTEEKNKFSHRRKAVDKLIEFLQTETNTN